MNKDRESLEEIGILETSDLTFLYYLTLDYINDHEILHKVRLNN